MAEIRNRFKSGHRSFKGLKYTDLTCFLNMMHEGGREDWPGGLKEDMSEDMVSSVWLAFESLRNQLI